MNSDCAFYIGTTHKVCEDYAVTHDFSDMSIAVLADGCSSSTDSDIGARILVKAAESREQTRFIELSFDSNIYINNARKISNLMNLDESSLDATLLMAKVQNGQFFLGCYGDGVVIKGFKDGGLYIRSVSFRTAYPEYLSYKINARKKALFDEVNQGADMEITYIYPSGNVDVLLEENIDIPECSTGSVDNLSFIGIMSDGVHSFYEQVATGTSLTNKPINYIAVIKEMFKIKGRKGEFIHRRINRFRKDCQAKNWHNFDDVSVAVINLE